MKILSIVTVGGQHVKWFLGCLVIIMSVISCDTGYILPLANNKFSYDVSLSEGSMVKHTASQNGIYSVNISSTSNHPSNATRSAHSVANGSRAIDINYINGQHVSPQNAYARYLQNLIRNTPGYLENYGPFIINKVVKGKVIDALWAREIRGGHYNHVHISMPK